MDIAVIGGGHGCYAAAAQLSENGHRVRLWRRDGDALAPVREHGIHVRDYRGARNVAIAVVTDDLATAMRGAALIVAPLPATTHEALAPLMAPCFEDDQVVFLPPGTFGSVLFARAIRAAGNPARVCFGETGTLPYLTRKHGPREIVISGYGKRLPTGIWPSARSEFALAVIREAYPAIEPIEDALSGALMNAGPIIHPPLILMNAGPLQHFPHWDIHNEGTQPAIRAVTDALDAERMAIREAFGYRAPHFPLAHHYAKEGEEWMYGRGAHDRLTDSGDWREHIDLYTHRYMLEDTRLGLSLLVSAGRYNGTPTPVASGLLAIASAAVGRDLYSEGRTFESLGLNALSREALSDLLARGYAA
ncbi:MAG: NAD/NADP octopine/nopaline dehydrogenase family protein [Pseudomonadales bacterium]|nr:NAD/NADP octopine/nopaline dehydrogenase family protein [Pseudomonadales bacterium]MCP5183541.1 NAD/NADP octopine/nopaline dehydrogenase family protein [Pseudomonadales bacterium]